MPCAILPIMEPLDRCEWPRICSALLWDIDNMPGKYRQFLSLARVLSLAVPDVAPRYAAARRSTWRRVQPMLSPLGFEVLSGGRSASGADRHLCDTGRRLCRLGHRRFHVVSNDHLFAQLAALGDVHVITLDPSNLSTRLREAASSVMVLRFDGTTWVPENATAPSSPLSGAASSNNTTLASGPLSATIAQSRVSAADRSAVKSRRDSDPTVRLRPSPSFRH